MNMSFNSQNESEDPDPPDLYQGFHPRNPGYDFKGYGLEASYGFEEKLADNASRFRHRHFDEGHSIWPDKTCDLCREMGLLERILH